MTSYPPLATVNDYADLIGPAPAGLNLSGMLDGASALIRRYCGWHVSPVVTDQVTVNGSGTGVLMLPSLMVLDVTAVTDTGSAIDPTTLQWSQDGYLYRSGASVPNGSGYFTPDYCTFLWSANLRGVLVSIQHGFDVVPEVTALACTVVARSAASPAGVIREQAGQVSMTYSQVAQGVSGGMSLMQHEMGILDAYRLPRVR